ncbi:MAG TPA: DUF3768 domain-containing protein [Rhizomicrobium sp.]|jgi:hypothetical protein
MTDKTAEIRRLNDLARTRPDTVNATWVVTQGVAYLLAGEIPTGEPIPADVNARFNAFKQVIAAFSDWTEDNDPFGEHDFGSITLFGEKLFWKIDYYHPDRDSHAPEPSSIETCRRVLTVLLAEEY